MATFAPITTFTNFLVGDTGTASAPPTPTLAGGLPISAFEFQSTTRAVMLPRMTSAQIGAIPNPADGMIAYNTDLADFVVRKNTVFTQMNPLTGVQYATANLTLANLTGMNAAPVQILAAPGAGKAYVIHGFLLNAVWGTAAFTGGGAIALQYGTAAAGSLATATINAVLLTTITANAISYSVGSIVDIPSANTVNAAISITNATAPFAVGTGCSAVVQVWYSIVSMS